MEPLDDDQMCTSLLYYWSVTCATQLAELTKRLINGTSSSSSKSGSQSKISGHHHHRNPTLTEILRHLDKLRLNVDYKNDDFFSQDAINDALKFAHAHIYKSQREEFQDLFGLINLCTPPPSSKRAAASRAASGSQHSPSSSSATQSSSTSARSAAAKRTKRESSIEISSDSDDSTNEAASSSSSKGSSKVSSAAPKKKARRKSSGGGASSGRSGNTGECLNVRYFVYCVAVMEKIILFCFGPLMP